MANNATPAIRAFSRRLVAHEAAAVKKGRGPRATTFAVCEQLRRPLTRLMGFSGFRTLLARALANAGRKVSWVRNLRVAPEGVILGLEDGRPRVSARSLIAGETAATAEFLGLLVTFIGPELTKRLLHEIWPTIDYDGF